MVPQFKVTAKAFLLFTLLLPSTKGNSNIYSQIRLKGSSSGCVEDNLNVNFNAVAQARLDVTGNANSDVDVKGGFLKFHMNGNGRASVKNSDLEVKNCMNYQIFGQKNKGIIKDLDNSDFTGNDNELDVVHCAHCRFFQTNKMTIFAKYSTDLRVRDSSNSKVKMESVESVQVSGRDFTLEGRDIMDHTFIGKRCNSRTKRTHNLTFLPSAKRSRLNVYIGRSVYMARSINFVAGSIQFGGAHFLSEKISNNNFKKIDLYQKTRPISLHFCNTAKVIVPIYEIGGLPRLTIEIKEEDNTASIRVAEGNPRCKIVSEDGEMKVSISTSSEELLIDGAMNIRRIEDGKCEFILSLGKDADSDAASDLDKRIAARDDLPAYEKVMKLDDVLSTFFFDAIDAAEDEDKDSMLGSLVAAANNALDLALSFVNKFFM